MNCAKLSLLVLTLACLATNVLSRPTGAPTGACNSLVPSHPASDAGGNGGFFIYTELFDDDNGGDFMANTTHRVVLATSTQTRFRGFIIQAVDADSGDLIGTFMLDDTDNSQWLTCNGNMQSTVTHTNNGDKLYISFYWNAPTYDGSVDFRYSIVVRYRMDYYANVSAAMNRPPCPVPPPIEISEDIFSIGTNGSSDYFFASRVNPVNDDYVDIFLQGVAAGWVGTGFSLDREMQEDDVLACWRVNGGDVAAVDTWNTAPRRSGNVVDRTQTDICTHEGSFTNGRIDCVFSRLIAGSDAGQDRNLNGSYWLFMGLGTAAQTRATGLMQHTTTPAISDEQINIFAIPDNRDEPTDIVGGAATIAGSFILLTISIALILHLIY